MSITQGNAQDGLQAGLAGRFAAAIESIFAGVTFGASTAWKDSLNAFAKGIVDALNNDKLDLTTQAAGNGSNGQLLAQAAGAPAWQGDTAWTAVTFQNSWANFGGFQTCAFFKDANGFVHLRGLLSGAAAALNTVGFTLPAGYRPSVQLLTWGISGNGGGTLGFNRIDIHTDGTVTIGTETSGSLKAFQSLEGIVFDTR